MKAIWLIVPLLLTGCSDRELERDIWWEDGYNAGQYDVCRELAMISESIKETLGNCRGY